MGCLSAPDAMSARIFWRTSSPINSCTHSITFLQKAVILFKEINQKNMSHLQSPKGDEGFKSLPLGGAGRGLLFRFIALGLLQNP